MPFDISGASGRHIAKEDNLLRLQSIKHFIVSVHEQSTCSQTFLRSDRGNGNTAADGFSVKAPVKATMIAPAYGWDDRHAHVLPVSASQVLAIVVVDLHGSGIIGKQAEIRRHDRLKFRKKKRISSGVMPCAFKDVIVHEEVNAVGISLTVGCRTVEADPVQPFIKANRRQFRRIVHTFAVEHTQPQIVSIALHRFKRYIDHLKNGHTPCPSEHEVAGDYQDAAKDGSYTEVRKVAPFSEVKPFCPSSATA